MPFPDESFDAVTCVYLFHELPPEVRKKVAREAARVLKPGGVFILADSIQLGDRPRVDANLGRFGDFNEPYYRSWLREDTVELFGAQGAGLEPWTKELCSSTKVLSFRKPKK
jgi:ubiquinone/menaquinone biosynthesis C-methylase UbiE